MITARFDCLGGASGNMLLGALIDAGLDVAALEHALRGLALPPWSLVVERVTRGGVAAVHVDVRYPEEHVHRHLPDIAAIVWRADIPEPVKHRTLSVFERLADAEARVHGISRDEVHFHEVGAVDAIIDVTGVVLGLSMLGVDQVRVSPLPVGTGLIRCAHGDMPNPAPATAELLRGAPLRFTDVPGERVTPTGAALLVTLGSFDPAPAEGIIERIGYGAGTRDPAQVANVVRVMLCHDASARAADTCHTDTVVMLETNIDDMNPQVFEHLLHRLFGAGALDAFLTPVLMKKSRPATQLTAICKPGTEGTLADIVLAETTSLGVRLQTVERRVLPREIVTISTTWGDVRVKSAGGRLRPEHDDCRRIAETTGTPLLEVMERVAAEARAQLG